MARRITQLDLERFSNGDCLILAQELHRLTDWPIYALHNGDVAREPEAHAFVLAPGKIAVDVQGAAHFLRRRRAARGAPAAAGRSRPSGWRARSRARW